MKRSKTKKELIYIVDSARSGTLRCDAAGFVVLVQRHEREPICV